MAERRMFAKSIVTSDAFLDMPMSARCLYFTLGMFADDDGFVGNPKSIMRQCGASIDDLKILLSKRFVLGFESGVIVIKHWRMNNYLRNDRHITTTYIEELGTLTIDEKGAYTETNKTTLNSIGIPSDNQVVDTRYTEDSIGKDSIITPLVSKDTIPPKGGSVSKKQVIPSFDDVANYCKERGNGIDPQAFIDYYASQNWKKANGRPLYDWKAGVRTWENKRKEQSAPKQRSNKMVEDLEERIRLNRSIDPRTGEPR